MANEHVFTGRAGDYVLGRPGYAPQAVELLCNELLQNGDRVADIGSGTGIFAGELMARGFDVFCVEPNEQMRRQAELAFQGCPHFLSVAGTAEATTLPDASVDAVTAASALHWFDTEMFSAEAQCILRHGGLLFAVGNGRDYADPFTKQQHALCKKLCPHFTSLRHGLEKTERQINGILGSGARRAAFDFPLEYTKEKFIRRSLSSSYAPQPGTPAAEEYAQQLRLLLDRFAPGRDTITIPNTSVAHWGRLT